MAELKHNFSQAKMNKDLDERVVPTGQYRDALNIEVATSEGANVGAAQTLMGNTKHATMLNTTGNAHYGIPDTATVVGAIASPDKDKIYYFVSGGDSNASTEALAVRKDYILEYDVITQTTKYVFVDIYSVTSTLNTYAPGSPDTQPDNLLSSALHIDQPAGTVASQTLNLTGVRVGMRATLTSSTESLDLGLDANVYVNGITYSSTISGGEPLGWGIKVSKDIYVNSNDSITFHGERVLNFNKNTIITGINILDDFIFWTDNNSEPKKINIPRSIAGTGGVEFLTGAGIDSYDAISTLDVGSTFKGDTDYFHTRLVESVPSLTSDALSYNVITFPDKKRAVYVDESHVTVIKKAPTQPLELKMSRSPENRQTWSGEFLNVPSDSLTTSTTNLNLGPNAVSVGDVVGSDVALFPDGVVFANQVDFRVGDIISLVEINDPVEEYTVRAEITASNVSSSNNLSLDDFQFKILSLADGIINETQKWTVKLFDKEPLFEFKFPRFSYRYKYIDGEYSPFAPFSQVAFLPSKYEYHPKKGYNLGMVNSLRSLQLTYYHYDEFSKPDDVVEIDLLYKEANNPTVYTVKTIKKSDEDPQWPNVAGEGYRRGSFRVTTDMIHAVVASNQLIRPYDNVPKKALSQEISANRLIYGNYVQNLTVLKDPIIQVSLDKGPGDGSGFALPSVKTQRTYQVGVVYSDKYGRETPVLTSKNATITVPKDAVKTRNRLSVKLDPTTEVPVWARYYSFYVKETSVEYYTMAMDRWYDAADGNIWISFPSSDRNKVDEETFLELKRGHGTNSIITDPARYKILAIENEAPDSVKMTRNDLGSVLDTGNAVIGNTASGYPLQDTTFITVLISSFESTFGDNLHISTPDRLFLRLFSQTNESEEYKVTRLIKGSTHYKLTIEGKFGPDAAFVSSNDTYAGRIGQLRVALYSSTLEAKPEFEGRFFAKIFKDELLVNSLSQDSEANYVISMTSSLRYINNNGYATGEYGNEQVARAVDRPYQNNGSDVHEQQDGGEAFLGINPREWNYEWIEDNLGSDYNFPNEDRYYWGGSSGESFGLQKSSLVKPSKAMGRQSDSEDFWRKMNDGNKGFFIDSCTAFSWTGKNDDRTGNWYNAWDYGEAEYSAYYSDGFIGEIGGGTALGDMGSVEAAPDQQAGAPPSPDGSYPHDPGSMQNASLGPGIQQKMGGMPSRGIWGGGKYMDISWSGFGEGYNGSNWSSAPFPHELKYTSGDERLAGASFMQALVTPGTKFRFQRDPDSTVYTVHDFAGEPEGYNNKDYWMSYADKFTGAYGIRNTDRGNDKDQYQGYQMRQRWTIKVTPSIGSGPSGYNPVTGTNPYVIKDETNLDFRRALRHDASQKDVIEIVVPFVDISAGKGVFTESPGIWETVPKESVDIDIYYQASGLIPLILDGQTLEEYIPIGTTFRSTNANGDSTTHTITGILENSYGMGELDEPAKISYTPSSISFVDNAFVDSIAAGDNITLTKRGNYSFTAKVDSAGGGAFLRIFGGKTTYAEVGGRLQEQTHILSWNNCYTFFNGVESDRMRDDFNAPQLDNGVKASTVLAEQILEERRAHGLIWSGIYNSSSGVNNTNQFIAGEAITKDVNPVHGSIQKLLNRDTRLIMFCEDSVLRAVTNKDALYNADGKPQLIASNAVIGDVQSYEGNYGVSKNPESVAHTARHVYFADVNRSAVCSLSGEGIIAISDKGMSDYFSDTFDSQVYRALGTYDGRKDEYNLSIYKKQDPLFQINKDFETTLSYSRTSQGWSSFKSFLPDNGVSINNNYYTFKNGHLWKHHSNSTRNRFYDTNYDSSISLLFNNNPEAVKSFGSINYEGSKAKISVFDYKSAQMFNNNYASTDGAALGLNDATNVTDGEYFNLGGLATNYNASPDGWYVENVTTNLQSCGNIEFKDKEGKFFGQISGEDTSLANLNEKEFSVQGLGHASMVHSGSAEDNPEEITIKVDNNTDITYTGNSGVGIAWDVQAD